MAHAVSKTTARVGAPLPRHGLPAALVRRGTDAVRDHGGQAVAYVYFEEEPSGAKRSISSVTGNASAGYALARTAHGVTRNLIKGRLGVVTEW
jgi:hypothetical protein